jgi:hypothetical protein
LKNQCREKSLLNLKMAGCDELTSDRIAKILSDLVYHISKASVELMVLLSSDTVEKKSAPTVLPFPIPTSTTQWIQPPISASDSTYFFDPYYSGHGRVGHAGNSSIPIRVGRDEVDRSTTYSGLASDTGDLV